MNATLVNKNVNATYFEAREIAKKDGRKLVSHVNLDAYKMAGNSGVFWAREFQISGVSLKKGNDVKDTNTKVILSANALKIAHENSKNGVYGRNDIVLFTDAKDFSESKGFKVIEEPTIVVVENPVLTYGGKGKADEITKIALNVSDEEFKKLNDDQKRWNYFSAGIWPLVLVFDGRLVVVVVPSYRFGVLVEGATNLKLFVPEAEKVLAQLGGVVDANLLQPLYKLVAAVKE